MDEEFGSALLTRCVLLASDIGLSLQDLPSDPPAACRSACRRRRARCAPAPTNESSSRAPGLPGRPRGRAGHCPTTSHDDGQGPNRRLGWPSTACASFEHEAPTQADDEPGLDAAATTPTPAIPAVRLPAPPPRSRTSLRPDTADAATHKHRTPTPGAHTGRRTADTWTLRRPHRTLDIGPVGQASVDTGRSHRTPDTGRWPRTWTR